MAFDVERAKGWRWGFAVVAVLSTAAFGLYTLFEVPPPSRERSFVADETAGQGLTPERIARSQTTAYAGTSVGMRRGVSDFTGIAPQVRYSSDGLVHPPVYLPPVPTLSADDTRPKYASDPSGVNELASPINRPPSPQAYLAWREAASGASREAVAGILRLHADIAKNRITDATDLEHPDPRIVEEVMADMQADVAADLRGVLTDEELEMSPWAPPDEGHLQTASDLTDRFAPLRSSAPKPSSSSAAYRPGTKREEVERIFEQRAAIARERLATETDQAYPDPLIAEQIMAETHADIVAELKGVVTEDELRALLWLPADADILSTQQE